MSTTTSTLSLPARRASTPRATRIGDAVARLWLRLTHSEAPTRAMEAAEVRRLATHVRNADPGFAADLFAAADRHERLPG